ncbi:FAD assembly factor SdhE [Methylomonas sp. MgM2]
MIDPNKLRWRCRRGTLELDLMLTRYLDQRFPIANETERQGFLDLLELEDSELMAYLMGERAPLSTEIAGLVAEIRKLPVDC